MLICVHLLPLTMNCTLSCSILIFHLNAIKTIKENETIINFAKTFFEKYAVHNLIVHTEISKTLHPNFRIQKVNRNIFQQNYYCTQMTHWLIMRNSNWNCSKWLSICLTIYRQKQWLNQAQRKDNNDKIFYLKVVSHFRVPILTSNFVFFSLVTNYNIYIFTTLFLEALKKRRKKKKKNKNFSILMAFIENKHLNWAAPTNKNWW